MPVTQNVLPGFRVKDPNCRLLECADGFCSNNCAASHMLDYKGRAMNGLGAGNGAHLPNGECGDQGSSNDFLIGRKAWVAGNFHDPHDGDFDDNKLGK